MDAMTIATLGLVEDEEIELDLAALALSELDHPGVDLTSHKLLLQDIAGRLKSVGAHAQTPAEQAGALMTVLHDELGFVGDAATYDAPLNGDLVRVLERRKGLPVSLSILYVAAARRMEWTADPLNTPGHVLVRLGKINPVVIDPFNGGAIVEPRQLAALLQRAVDASAGLDLARSGPMTNRTTLVRLLMNQATRAEEGGDPGRAMTMYQRMTLIAPDHPDGWWSLARLQLVAGMIDQARASLSAMLEVTRDAERRELVMSVLDRISNPSS